MQLQNPANNVADFFANAEINNLKERVMTDWWKTNLEALKSKRPALYRKVIGHARQNIGELLPTSSGHATLRFTSGPCAGYFAYNTENPWNDVEKHLETVPPESKGLALFVGMGLGYGPSLVLRERPDIPKIVILEPSMDIFCAALQAMDLGALFADPKVSLYVGDISWEEFEEDVSRLASLEDTHMMRYLPCFQWNAELYGGVNSQAFTIINQMNVSGATTKKIGKTFFRNRFENLVLLRQAKNIDILKDAFKGKPAVLVAAGPSLDKSLSEIKKVAGRCVLIAADSALAPLASAGIVPDFVTTTDFLDLNFEKLTPFLGEKWPFSLVATIKGCPLVPKRFPARYNFLTFPEDIPHNWMVKGLHVENYLSSGLSVAHLSLALAQHMGAEPIFLTGQDLAFTGTAGDHAGQTILQKEGITADKELLQVEGLDGEPVTTDRAFACIQAYFEEMISQAPRTYYNATVSGVRIKGAESRSLQDAKENFAELLPVSQIVEEAVTSRESFAVSSFVSSCQKNLVRVKQAEAQVKKQMQKAPALRANILRQSALPKVKKQAVQSFEDLSSGLQKQLHTFDRVNTKLDQDQIWDHILELTYDSLSENDQHRERNDRVRQEKGYLGWLLAELDRIMLVNKARLPAMDIYRTDLKKLIDYLQEEEKLVQKNDLPAQAHLYVKFEKFFLAREVLEKLLEFPSVDVDLLLLAGEVYAQQLDFSKALQCWQQAVQQNPEAEERAAACRAQCAAFWIGMADKYGNANDEGDNFPHLLPVWFARVNALWQDAAGLPEPLVGLWDKHRHEIASLLEQHKTDVAAITLKRWQIFEKKIPEITSWKALVAAADAEDSQSLADVVELGGNFSENPLFLASYARILLEAGIFDNGIAVLQKAVSLDPNTAILWEELGDVLMADGDYGNAALAFESCFVALPERLEVLRKVGDCYLQQQQFDAAISAYEAVLAKSPDDQQAKEHLAQVQKVMGASSGNALH